MANHYIQISFIRETEYYIEPLCDNISSDQQRYFIFSENLQGPIHTQETRPEVQTAVFIGSEIYRKGAARNLAVPRGFNDSELSHLMNHAILPMAREFEPQALVITGGTDALDGDPLSGMALRNVGLWAAVERLLGLCDHNVVLGGGGYNPWTLLWTRCPVTLKTPPSTACASQ